MLFAKCIEAFLQSYLSFLPFLALQGKRAFSCWQLVMCLPCEQFIKRDCFQENYLYKPGRGLSPLMDTAEIACRINMQLLKDHYSILNSSLMKARAREVRIGEAISIPRAYKVSLRWEPSWLESCQGMEIAQSRSKTCRGWRSGKSAKTFTTAPSCSTWLENATSAGILDIQGLLYFAIAELLHNWKTGGVPLPNLAFVWGWGHRPLGTNYRREEKPV